MSDPVPALTFWYEGRPIADIVRSGPEPADLSLRYHETWSGAADAFPISARFPLGMPVDDGAAIYFWLMNLLPEDDALRIVGMNIDVADIDVLTMVTAMGGDLPGALVARADGEAWMPGKPHMRIWTEAELAHDIRRLPERPLLMGDEGVQMSLAGQQAKLPVVLLEDGRLALPLDGEPSTHILKPSSAKLFASVENEAFCMRLAQRCGLEVAQVTIGHAEDLTYLLVRRYDRMVIDGTVRRLHQEDLCQALGVPPYRKYQWNARTRTGGPAATGLFAAVSNSPFAAPNRIAMLDGFVFNVLVCNVDSHAKNYSLLHRSNGARMAPLYDVMCGAIYEDVTRNLPQKIAGKQRGDHIYGRHWSRLAVEIGLSPAAVRRRVAVLARSVLQEAPVLAQDMSAHSANARILEQLAELVEARCRRVLTNLDDGAISDAVAEAEDEPEPTPGSV